MEELNSVLIGLIYNVICGKLCTGVGQVSVINKPSSLLLYLYKIIGLNGIVHAHSRSLGNVVGGCGKAQEVDKGMSWQLESLLSSKKKKRKRWPGEEG